MSSPSWGRGLKYRNENQDKYHEQVVPLVGTWIEIHKPIRKSLPAFVVPLVGTWIEIRCSIHPSWTLFVVPLVGTWIEIAISKTVDIVMQSSPSWGRGLK